MPGAASAWYLSHRRIARALDRLPERQWMRLRSEDLLRPSRAHLPRLLTWLKLPASDDVIVRMMRTEGWQFAGDGQAGRLYGGDSKFIRAPALRPPPKPGPVTFDRSWGLTDEMCRRMGALACYLRY